MKNDKMCRTIPALKTAERMFRLLQDASGKTMVQLSHMSIRESHLANWPCAGAWFDYRKATDSVKNFFLRRDFVFEIDGLLV